MKMSIKQWNDLYILFLYIGAWDKRRFETYFSSQKLWLGELAQTVRQAVQ